MKSFTLSLLLAIAFFAHPAWAEWSQNGQTWDNPRCAVTIPSAMKASTDPSGNLTAESDKLLVVFIPVEDSVPTDQIMQVLVAAAQAKFANLMFSDAQLTLLNGMDVTSRTANYGEGGAQVTITLGQFVSGNHKMAVMSVQPSGDQATEALLLSVLKTIQLK